MLAVRPIKQLLYHSILKVYDRLWERNVFTFDNVPQAMLTLVVVMTFEGWPRLVKDLIHCCVSFLSSLIGAGFLMYNIVQLVSLSYMNEPHIISSENSVRVFLSIYILQLFGVIGNSGNDHSSCVFVSF